MVRRLAIIGMFALLAAAWLIFELHNIWPFNGDRIEVLRIMFALGTLGTIAAFTWGCSPLLPPASLATAFVSTAAYSQAVMTPTYVLMVAVIVVLVAALGLAACRPLNVRFPPIIGRSMLALEAVVDGFTP
ncbi:hypothetical protein [Sphingomonas sp. ACRSK]|uniref:hypothetical protein n=1 Tax=Sphingomonas sp. ACRSK TaxID=2918213 RepID=UPI001EF6E91F|nr:hypothetical protein [Sphingomonas sp. ACRSK]MCG7348398.1 hypothetical protein [Sphingomonas sp. ACRSK]